MSLGTDAIYYCACLPVFVLTTSQEVNKRSLNEGQMGAGLGREQAAHCSGKLFAGGKRKFLVDSKDKVVP